MPGGLPDVAKNAYKGKYGSIFWIFGSLKSSCGGLDVAKKAYKGKYGSTWNFCLSRFSLEERVLRKKAAGSNGMD